MIMHYYLEVRSFSYKFVVFQYYWKQNKAKMSILNVLIKEYFAYLGLEAGQGHVTGGGQEAAAVIGGEIVAVIAEAEVTGLGREVCQGQRVDLGELR